MLVVIETGKNKTTVNIDYNYEAFRELKKVPESQFNEDGTWQFESKYIKHLLKQLHELSIDVKNELAELREMDGQVKYDSEVDKETIKTVKITVKENQKSLALNFDYDPEILKHIKNLESRQYNAKNKSWRIQKTDVNWLYEKLKVLEYVDLTDLDKFTSNSLNRNNEISLKDFPNIQITPYEFQMDTVNKLVKNKKMINALEAGLGKTPITVMACEYIKKKTIILCPASIKENWRKEIHKINPNADVVVLDGKDEWKSAQYIILNYDIVDRFYDNIKNDNFEISVFDESHKLRGVTSRGLPSSKRAKYSLAIAGLTEYVFPITATPFINYTKDIFNLLKAIECPSAKGWYMFANTYCKPTHTGYGVNYDSSSNQDQLNERLYPNYMMRLKTEDHVDLPDRTRSFIPVKVNMSKYQKAVNKYMNDRDSLEENGQHLVYLSAMRKELAVAKSKEAVKMIKDLLEQNKSVVVFTNYRKVADTLCEKFNDDCVKITGDVDAKDRQKQVDLFQSGEKRVFVGNIDAAGEGITLTKAHHMIVIDLHWSPVVMVNQMEKRIHRISQDKTVLIQYLYVEEAQIDKMMLETLESKLNDSSMIIDGKSEDFFVNNLIKEF